MMQFTSSCGLFKIVCKDDFSEVNPKYLNEHLSHLFLKDNLADFLHNENGPAIEHRNGKMVEYWIDGKCLVGEDLENFIKKLHFKNDFNSKLES